MVVPGNLGKLYGISAGTGDPELITIKGWRMLRQADIVAYPAGWADQTTISEAIAQQFVQSHQQKLPLPFPTTARQGLMRTAWQTATINILQHLRQGQTVAFIAEGDANFYSNFAYILLAVKTKQPEVVIEVIPGVSAPAAAAAIAGIPLTTCADKLIVLPHLNTIAELEDALSWAEVVVVLDISPVYREVWQTLRKHQLLGYSHVIAAPHLHWSDLSDHPLLNLPPLSVMIVSRSHAQSLLGF